MRTNFNRIILVTITVLLCTGFRVFEDRQPWRVSKSSEARSKLFVVYDNPSTNLENDLQNDDPLAGDSDITVEQAMDSIFENYNNIDSAYIMLVDSNDTDYAAQSENRTITIKEGGTDGATAGEAQLTYESGYATKCVIVLSKVIYESAHDFIRTVTHELGHCLGLDHPHDTTNAIMSYFSPESNGARLQVDDKMGITFLYPEDSSKGIESATFGLSCSTRD